MARQDQSSGKRIDRRSMLTGLAASAVATSALAQADDPLQQLIQQNQRSGLGAGFDSASRTIQMPKASLPTLSPETVQHTQQAIAQFESIVASGGWSDVAQSDRMRLGARHPAVSSLFRRLTTSGDLDPNAGALSLHDARPLPRP